MFHVPHAQINPLRSSTCLFGASRPLKGIFHLEWPQCPGPPLSLSCSHSSHASQVPFLHLKQPVHLCTHTRQSTTSQASMACIQTALRQLYVPPSRSQCHTHTTNTGGSNVHTRISVHPSPHGHPSLLTTHKYHFLAGLTFPLSLHSHSPSPSHTCGC